jgi:hypothetical protein
MAKIILSTADTMIDPYRFYGCARAILVWPNADRHPSAIVFAPRTFVTPLDVAGMDMGSIHALDYMMASGHYMALWHNGHVTVTAV